MANPSRVNIHIEARVASKRQIEARLFLDQCVCEPLLDLQSKPDRSDTFSEKHHEPNSARGEGDMQECVYAIWPRSKQGDSTVHQRLYSHDLTNWHQNAATCGRTLARIEHLHDVTAHLNPPRGMPIAVPHTDSGCAGKCKRAPTKCATRSDDCASSPHATKICKPHSQQKFRSTANNTPEWRDLQRQWERTSSNAMIGSKTWKQNI